MDYEKKHKEEIVRATQLWECGDITRENLEYIFPELAESEDERIRKGIKSILEHYKESGEVVCPYPFISIDAALAWLEKQGEKKPTDKIEPKFHEGDWVIDKQGIVHQIAKVIENVTNHSYGYDIVGGGYFNDNAEGVRLWTIQDAKDGDVLHSPTHHLIWIYKGNKHYYASINLNYADGISFEGDIVIPSDVCPANKLQRSILFQKMEEAGYTWNTNKKELKKIEQKSTEWYEKTKGLDELETYILSIVPNRPLDAVKVDSKNIRFLINKEQKPWSEEDGK